MSKYVISDKAWSRYRSIIKNFIDKDAGLQVITWKKRNKRPNNFGEDGCITFTNIEIKALCNFNSYRTWPINIPSASGELDKMNLAIIVTKDMVESVGGLDTHGYWEFDQIADRFVINGKTYISKGDTEVAQAKDKNILFQVVLQRDVDDIETI